MKLYKVLADNGRPHHGGSGTWPLPTDDGPGAWWEVSGELVPCQHGLHLCRVEDVLFWAGPRLYEAEHDGEIVEHGSVRSYDSKVVVRRARLLREVKDWPRIARLLAADCAERVLCIYERDYPDDDRPREAIGVARRHAVGEASDSELAAARAAARDAAWDAAWAAARDAAWDAARAAARDAAWAAARDAARAAAWAAEHTWQTERLRMYLDGVDPMPPVEPVKEVDRD